MSDTAHPAPSDGKDAKTILHVVNARGRAELKRTAGGELVYVRADGTQIVKEPPTQEGDWVCAHCGVLNWGSKKRVECLKCKEKKDVHHHFQSEASPSNDEFQKKLQQSLEKNMVDSPTVATPLTSPKRTFKTGKKRVNNHPVLKLGGIAPVVPIPPTTPAPNLEKPSVEEVVKKNPILEKQLSIINQVTSGTSGSSVSKVKARLDDQIRTSTRRQMKGLKTIKKASDLEFGDLRIDETNALGAGAYGKVYKCWVKADEEAAKKDGKQFPKPSDIKAIKVMKLDQGGCREDYEKNATAARNELRTWIAVTGGMIDETQHRKRRHASTHVVIPLRPFEDATEFKILMDFMHFGSLDDLMLAISRIPADEVQSMVSMISQGGPDPMDRIQIPEKDGPTTPPARPDSLTPLPEPALSYVMEMVLKGLEFLHELKVDGQVVNMVHQDIKPGNILIDNWAMVKIADFGLAGFMNAGFGGGTRLYMPPEMATNKELTQAADLWSLGVSAMECALGLHSQSSEHLFSASATSSYLISRDFDPDESAVRDHVSWDSVLQTIQNNDRLSGTWSKLSEPFKDFCQNCLTFNPSERPPAKVLKSHQFIVGRSKWKKPEMKAFLDTLVQRLITQDRLTGGTGEAEKWDSRGWQSAKSKHAHTECSSSTQSSVPIYFSSTIQKRRKMWMGSWRGRGRGLAQVGRGGIAQPRGPPQRFSKRDQKLDPVLPPTLALEEKPVRNPESERGGA